MNDKDFSIGDPGRFEIDLPVWSIANRDRLNLTHPYDALVIVPVGNRGKCLLIFPVIEDAQEFIEKCEAKGLVPVQFERIESLIPLLEYSQSQGSTHVAVDAIVRYGQVGGKLVPIPYMLEICREGLKKSAD